MNNTRRAFLNAGSVIAIVLAVIFALIGIIAIVVSQFITTDNLCEVYEKDTENFKTYYVNDNKDEGYAYFVLVDDSGKPESVILYKEVKELARLLRVTLTTWGWATILLEVASLVVSIFVLRDAKKGNNRNAFIIALLVLSLVSFNILTFAFMIVGLCLKNKEKEVVESLTSK